MMEGAFQNGGSSVERMPYEVGLAHLFGFVSGAVRLVFVISPVHHRGRKHNVTCNLFDMCTNSLASAPTTCFLFFLFFFPHS